LKPALHQAYLSLGSNENPKHYLVLAVEVLKEQFGEILLSPIYRTVAVGFDGPDFLNAAVRIETHWDVLQLDIWLHQLEDKHGRKRNVPHFSNRTLDIDIIFFDDLIFKGEKNLQIPRPELKHAFVLKPLADIAPDFRDPISGKTLAELWVGHSDSHNEMVRESFV